MRRTCKGHNLGKPDLYKLPDGAKCLHDLLDIDDEMKEFVSNYKLNLYDCHEHDTFDEYHTGLKQLFEVIRYGRDKEQLRRIMEENREAYINMDSDTRELLDVVANVKFSQKCKTMENGKGRYNMLKAFEDMKEDGRIEHQIQLVCKKLQKNKPIEVIAEELEEELSQIKKIVEAQRIVGSYDAEKIHNLMTE